MEQAKSFGGTGMKQGPCLSQIAALLQLEHYTEYKNTSEHCITALFSVDRSLLTAYANEE